MVDLLLFYQHIHSMLIGPKEVVVISEQVSIIRSDTSSITTIFSAVCMHFVNTCLLLRKLYLVPFAINKNTFRPKVISQIFQQFKKIEI